jgi:uncharacterized surface protein with fasciclin (FAS1) repeats
MSGKGKSPGWGKNMQSILDTARSDPRLNEFVRWVEAAGMAEALRERGPFTVFAPIDPAFGDLPEDLTGKRERLADVLAWHIVVGALPSGKVATMRNPAVRTLRGAEIVVGHVDGVMQVNTARVVEPDIACTNGILHIIDSVLMPTVAESVLK